MIRHERMMRSIWPAVPILLVVAITILMILLVSDVSPAGVFEALWIGSFGSTQSTLSTLAYFVPILLCAAGLLITFTAGLWNIGVEGQMIMGAIAASWVALELAAPYPKVSSVVIIPLELLLGAGLGALWAALIAILKTRGGVHEIFGGVALNGLASIMTNYLISTRWQPPEGGSLSFTRPFPLSAQLPRLADSRFNPMSAVIALLALALVVFLLRRTSWGLQLRALGKNHRSAFLLGVSSERQVVTGMMFCGALAGLAGAIRVLTWYDYLPNSVSGGIGFLAILIALLAGMRPLATLLIALLFSALLQGGTRVQTLVQIKDISGLIQGLLVLFVLLFGD